MAEIWKYLVDDYLEIKCRLKPADRLKTLQILERRGVRGKKIQPCESFLIGKTLVVVFNGAQTR